MVGEAAAGGCCSRVGACKPLGVPRSDETAPSAGSAPTPPETNVVAAHTNANTATTDHVLNPNIIAGESTIICTTNANYFANLKQAKRQQRLQYRN